MENTCLPPLGRTETRIFFKNKNERKHGFMVTAQKLVKVTRLTILLDSDPVKGVAFGV